MNKLKRALSLVLCVAMLISFLPMNVLAVDDVNGTCTIAGGTIYKLVDGPTAGKNYLILSRNTAGSANALSRNGNNIANQTVTVKAADDKSGAVYVETIGSATVWTADSGLKFKNGTRYLTASYSNYWYSLGTGATGTSFTYDLGNHALFTIVSDRYGRETTVYVGCYYRSSIFGSYYEWGVGTDTASVYFYEETDVPDRVYSLVAQDQQVAVGDSIDVDSIIRNLRLDGATIEDTLGGQYSYEIISGHSYLSLGNNNTLVGEAPGTATVRVKYTWDNGSNVVWDNIEVLVTGETFYTVDIKYEGNSTNVLAVKGVTEGTTRQLAADVLEYGRIPVSDPTITWEPSNTDIVSVDSSGKLTFTGKEGKATISAVYEVNGVKYTDQITVTTSKGAYIIPADGTNDFPEYPNEGSVRFDKTATAVGNFNETGLAQVELSVTGVPYTTNNEIDVVIMLDMSSSMNQTGSPNRQGPAIEAAQAALETIVKNEDGSFNGNRVAIYGFNGWLDSNYSKHILDTNCTTCNNITQIAGLQSYNQSNYDTTYTAIQSQYSLDSGTNYAVALKQCYETLYAAKRDGIGNNRKQFVIFMTDGAASTGFAYVDSSSSTGYSVYDNGDLGNDGYSKIKTVAEKTEYFSTQMKNDGVTIYSVGVQIYNSDDTKMNHAKTVLKKIGGTSEGNATQAGFEQYAIFVDEDVSDLVNAFQQAALSIKEAAKDVVIADQMGSEYTMVFEAPNQTSPNQKYYIEILNFDLNPSTNDRIGNGTSVLKLYMGKANKLDANDNVILDEQGKPVQCYYAASNAGGTAYASPVFEAKPLGSMYYWTTQNITGNPTYSGVSVKVGSTTYYFDTQGKKVADDEAAPDGWYNMTSGAYASGTVTVDKHADVAGNSTGNTNYCNDLIIATPNFVYNANEVNGRDKMLYWTLEKIGRNETVMRYFLYLDNSGGYHGSIDQEAGTYPTNEGADLTYTNFQDNRVQQEFPIPQMTWHGAQMSYVFYLVNEQGQPVNRAGRVVPFSEAVYVTDVYTTSVTWSGNDTQDVFQAEKLASEVVPDVYTLFDKTAYYNIHVFANEKGAKQNNHFEIGGTATVNTTYVFNTKADAEKYNKPGVYAKEGLDQNKAVCNFCDNGYKVVNGGHPRTGFDYYDTVVAFAVLWIPSLGEDEIVVDYGLDVVVDVAQNDLAIAEPVGLMATPPKESNGEDVTINSGQFFNPNTVDELDLFIDVGNVRRKIATAEMEGRRVRITLDRSNAMHFTDDLLFYYVSQVRFYQGDALQTVYMYTSVRVIPATTLYFEEDYVFFEGNWETVSSGNGPRNTTATQDVDRPGPNKLGAGYDADNVYGFDSAYSGCTEYSMDGAKMVEVTALTSTENVQKKSGPTATFSFTGTGFDIIGRTDTKTTSIIVRVDDQDEIFVDTYFEGVVEEGVTAIKQVPVVTVRDLSYGTHNVSVEVVINNDEGSDFAHGETGKFYLDAVRIYEPAIDKSDNKQEDATGYLVAEAYKEDKEFSPTWDEFGNAVLQRYGVDKMFSKAMFIDGDGKVTDITKYDTWGPNNELYLAPGQTIVLSADTTFLKYLSSIKNAEGLADMQLGIKLASGTSTSLTVTGDTDEEELTLNSATDLNFSIGALYCPPDAQSTATAPQIASARTITIKNTGPGLVALTNLKVTLKAEKVAVTYASDDLSGGKNEDPVIDVPQQRPTEPAEPIPEAPNTLIAQGILMIKQAIAAVIIAVANIMDAVSSGLQRIAEALFAGGG